MLYSVLSCAVLEPRLCRETAKKILPWVRNLPYKLGCGLRYRPNIIRHPTIPIPCRHLQRAPLPTLTVHHIHNHEHGQGGWSALTYVRSILGPQMLHIYYPTNIDIRNEAAHVTENCRPSQPLSPTISIYVTFSTSFREYWD